MNDSEVYREIRERDRIENIGCLQPPTFKSVEETAREMFSRDVEIMRHLVFMKFDEAPEGITTEAEKIAEDCIDFGVGSPASAESVVMNLYRLDETKQHVIELLEG